MKPILATLVAITALSVTSARAADNSFVGKWKFNPEKSQLSGLTYKVADAGDGKQSFTFGDDTETLALDGSDHTTKYGGTWSITQNGSNAWKWIRKRDGKITSDAIWALGTDGTTSTYTSTETRPDGSTSKDETTLKRTAGNGPGLVGTWESTGTKVGSPTTIEIAKWEDGYSLKDAAYKGETNFKADGKEYTPKGPMVPAGMTVSAKAMGEDKMELTYKMKDKMTEVDTWSLSADGKTLTNTVKFSGESKPEVDVYDRQ
jgi:hypothetical protein